MLGFGLGEILIIVAVALVVVGPEQLPRVLRQLGRWYGQARRAADELRRAFVLEADRQDAADRYAKLRERREKAEALRAARKAEAAEVEPMQAGDDPDDDPIEGDEEERLHKEPGPVAQTPHFVEPEPLPEGTEPPAEDPNAHPPDAPHPTRPTPLSGEMP